MIKYLRTIDPGMSTGVALGCYSETMPYKRIDAWHFTGGLWGLIDQDYLTKTSCSLRWWEVTTVCERFIPLATKGFALTSDAVEPLRIEGALIEAGIMPADYSDSRWQRPGMMYFMAGPDDSTPAKKKRAMHLWMKEHGFGLTGKDVNAKDADDALSATAHAIAYMRHIDHVPTIREYLR